MKRRPRNQIIRTRTEANRYAFFAAAEKGGPMRIVAVKSIYESVTAQLETSYREVSQRFLHGRGSVTEIRLCLTPRISDQLGKELSRCQELTELMVPSAWAKLLRAFVIADPSFDIRKHIPNTEFLSDHLSHSVLLEYDENRNGQSAASPHFDLAVYVDGPGISRWLHDICLDIAVFHSIPDIRQAMVANARLGLPIEGKAISELKCEFLLLRGQSSHQGNNVTLHPRYASFAERARDESGQIDYAQYRELWSDFLTFIQHGWSRKGKGSEEVETALFQAIMELLGCRGHLKVRELRRQFAEHFATVQQGEDPVRWFTLAVLVKMPARRGRDQVLRSLFGNRLKLWRSRILAFQPTHPKLLKSSAVAMVLFPIAKLATQLYRRH